MLFWIAAAVVLAALGLGAWIRLAPSDPVRWHVDPVTAPDPATPNFARVDRVVAMPMDRVAAAIAARAQAEGAVMLAGQGDHLTWLARTRWVGYPDYVSLRLLPADGGTRIVALSRSRFGHSDLGVNAERLDRWLPR